MHNFDIELCWTFITRDSQSLCSHDWMQNIANSLDCYENNAAIVDVYYTGLCSHNEMPNVADCLIVKQKMQLLILIFFIDSNTFACL